MKKLLLTIFLVLAVSVGNTASDTKVLICKSKTAHKYHSHYCRGLKRCTHSVVKVTIKEAVELGYSACGYCYK